MGINKIYVDLDGALVDFKGGVQELGWSDEEAKKYENDDPMWKLIAACPRFYANLKSLDGAVEFINKLIDKYGKDKVEILSAVPKEKRGVVTSREDKITWCKKYLPEGIRVNLCLRAEKTNYCKEKSYILIDGLEKNCHEWEAAGGTAIECMQDYNEMFDKIIKKEIAI